MKRIIFILTPFLISFGCLAQGNIKDYLLNKANDGGMTAYDAYKYIGEATSCPMHVNNNIYIDQCREIIYNIYKNEKSKLEKAKLACEVAYIYALEYPYGYIRDKNGNVNGKGKKNWDKAEKAFLYAMNNLFAMKKQVSDPKELGKINLYLSHLKYVLGSHGFKEAGFYTNYYDLKKIKMEDLLREAASSEVPEAMFEYGSFLMNHDNAKEAHKWLEKAANAGNIRAMGKLASLYYNGGTDVEGIVLVRDFDKAVAWASKAVYEDIDATITLGLCKFYGLGCEQNYDEAVKYLEFAVIPDKCCSNLWEYKDLEPYYALWVSLIDGPQSLRDEKKAHGYWELVSKQHTESKNSNTYYFFGNAYYERAARYKQAFDSDNYKKAVGYLEKSISNHDKNRITSSKACYLLYHCYALGRGVDVDMDKAMEYLARAAKYDYNAKRKQEQLLNL